MRRLLPALALLALAACDPPPSSSAAASASASAAPAPASTPAPEPLAAPDNLDVASLQKSLKCGGDAKAGACGVLARFTSCTAWDAVSPGGEARFLGRGVAVEGGKSRDAFVVVRSRRVPLAEVAPGQIGAKIAVGELTKDEGGAFDQADRTVRAFERNDVPPKSSPTLEYLKKRTEWKEAFAAKTTGGQVFAEGAYLCQGPRHELLLVQRGSKSSADGLYAELWPVTW
jgi:hypothetical protein